MKKLDVEKVAKWFRQELWTKDMLIDAVNKGGLDKEDYEKIVGEEFPTEN